jgi:hypothetical protein
MAVDIPELDLGVPGLLRTSWFNFTLSDPTSFHVVILLAASNYVSTTGRTKDVPDLLYLKQRAICSTLAALENTNSVINDQLISSTMKLASYEAIYGTFSAYRMHMTAAKKLVAQIGGLDKLGLNGLLMRICLWIECNSAFLHNSSQKFFIDQAIIRPNPCSFVGPSWLVRRALNGNIS